MNKKSGAHRAVSEIIYNIKSPNIVVHYQPVRKMINGTDVYDVRGGTYYLLTQKGNKVESVATVKRFVKYAESHSEFKLTVSDEFDDEIFSYTDAMPDVKSPLNTHSARVSDNNKYAAKIVRFLNRKLGWQHNNGRDVIARNMYYAYDLWGALPANYIEWYEKYCGR